MKAMIYPALPEWEHLTIKCMEKAKKTPETNTKNSKMIMRNPGKSKNQAMNPETTILGKTSHTIMPQ